jgi:hypothetical protein
MCNVFINGLFKNAVSTSDYIFLNVKNIKMVKCKYTEHGRMWSWPNSMYDPDICLSGLRKATKTAVVITILQANL